jgi:hypothetical protein
MGNKMEEYQKRVVMEYAELLIKVISLRKFLESKTTQFNDRGIMIEQLEAMQNYLKALRVRINGF